MLNWSPLLLLPRELSSIIYNELELTDLKEMCLTCKSLENDVAPLVLSHITFSGNKATTVDIEEVVSDLHFLTKQDSAIVNYSTKITFKLDGSIFRCNDVERTSKIFFTALTSFRCVQTVNWHTGVDDPLWLQESIWKAIGVFPNLRHLTIYALFLDESFRNFDSLKTLQSINISGDPFKYNDALFLSIARLYASSSSLSSITIRSSVYDKSSGYSSQQLFSSSPRDNPAHHLRCLALSDIPVNLDEVSLSHLTHLTSLKLSSLPFNSRPDDIWVALRQSKICLEELEVGFNVMGDSLNDYLSSFFGLKKLDLSVGSRTHASAVKFWSNCFPNHVDTLQDFSLRASSDDQWCFGNHNRHIIATCTNLKRIKMSLLPDDIPTGDSDFNGINSFIDTVVTHMPLAEQIDLLVSSREIYRHLTCGTRSISDINLNERRIIDWIRKYKPPTPRQSSPRLTVGTVSVFMNAQSQVRYSKTVKM